MTADLDPAAVERLREHIAVMADWLDVLAAHLHDERGEVLAVVEGRRAADVGRRLADVRPGPVAQEARDGS